MQLIKNLLQVVCYSCALCAADTAFVVNYGDGVHNGSLTIVDTLANIPITTVSVGVGAVAIVFSPDGTKAFVLNAQDETHNGSITVLNTSTYDVISTVTVGVYPQALAITPDGSKIFVINQSGNNVTVVDAAMYVVLATIDVGEIPSGLAITPNGRKVFVSNYIGNSLTVLDVESFAVLETISVVANPYGVFITPDGSEVAVPNIGDNTVSIINAETYEIITNINVGTGPIAIDIMSDGAIGFVPNTTDFNVSVINMLSNSAIPLFTTSAIASGFLQFSAISPDGQKLFVSAYGSSDGINGTLSILETAAPYSTLASVTVGLTPRVVAISSNGIEALVANNGSNSVSVIDTTTYALLTTIPVGQAPSAIGILPVKSPSFNRPSNRRS